jgi:ATP-dependent helicase/nuclease subunit B
MILTKENIGSLEIDKIIDDKISSGKINELLLIVPTNRKARNLKKEIISKMPGKSAAGINIETIGTLSSKLLRLSKPFINLSEAASVVFIKQSTSEIKLRYFSVYENKSVKGKIEIPFGSLDRIKNVISEYKRHGINPAELRKEAGKLDKSEKLKALDIADIYEKYLSKCYGLNAYETGDIYSVLLQLPTSEFEQNFVKNFKDVNVVIINGFDEFAVPEIKLIERLSNIDSHKLFVHFDYSEKNRFLFSHLDKTYERFEEYGFKKIKEVSMNELEPFHKLVREKLFRTRKFHEKFDYKNSITRLTAYDRDKEVEIISREIKELIEYENIEPHKICVAFNLIQNYSPIVRDVFDKNGLPYNLSDRISLDNSNPVKAVVNFLEIAGSDFYYNNVFRALSSGFLDIGGIDTANLLKVASALKIVSGKENWVNSIQDEITNLKFKADDDEDHNRFLYKVYSKALTDLKTIAGMLEPFECKSTIDEFRKYLFDLIYKSQISLKLLRTSENGSTEKNIRGFTAFLDTITEILQLLEEEFGTTQKFGLQFFTDQIITACGWARFNVKEKSNFGVQVTTLEEIRGLQFDYLFIGGLCDGDFPTRYRPEIFYSGSFKKKAITHQTEERNLFYQSLCCWNKKLFLSYYKTDGGRETVKSTFLNDFEELFDISAKDEINYSKTIYSGQEVQINAGEIGFSKIPLNIKMNLDEEKIKEAIHIDKLRSQNPLSTSSFCGDLSNTNSALLLNHFSSKQYSISELELYAKCPFKFFIERVLGIEKIEEPTEDIEAVEMGRILHEVLYKFYAQVRQRNIIISGCDDKTFEKVKDLIYEVANKELETTAFKSPLTFFEKEKITGIGGNKNESVLYRFLQNERCDESGFIPKYFEVSFGKLKDEGTDKLLSDKEPVNFNGINLRGKIDRLEISEDENAFNIVDYKLSGKKPTFNELKEGISLQLPVYLFTAAELLKKKIGKDISPNEMIIYSLKYSLEEFGKSFVSLGRGKEEEIKTVEQLIENTMKKIKFYVQQISIGKFGLSPHENREQLVCRYCQFKPVCRVQESF